MGRQKSNAVFLGTYAGITGFADEGKGFWRRRTSLDGVQWRTSPSMAACRDAAVLFGAASTAAGCLWRMLPDGMKRLADGGAFNRLVAACRNLMEEGGGGIVQKCSFSKDFTNYVSTPFDNGQLTMDDGSVRGLEIEDVDGLRGLDLSIESMGPHGVISEKVKVKNGQRDLGGFGDYRLTGLDALFSQMDEALGDSVGRKSGKFAVARRVSPSRVLDEGEVLGRMGSMEGWLPRRRRGVDSSGAPEGRDGLAPVQRRVRVWVQAVRLVPLVWVEGMECFVPGDDLQPFTNGFVTDWIAVDPEKGSLFPIYRDAAGHGNASEWEDSYPIAGQWGAEGLEEGDYVVFTAIEVAEKRGRHWVRLPWCCKMRVQDVVFHSPADVATRDEVAQLPVDDLGWGWVRFASICVGLEYDKYYCDAVEIGRIQSKGIRAGP